MKLYYSPGACSLAVHITLRVAGVDFALERVGGSTKLTEAGADFHGVNPKGYVPALELDSGEVLTEAPAILQNVADLAPQSGLAPAPATIGRVRLQEQLNYVSSELHKAFKPFFAGTPITDAERPAAEAAIGDRMRHIEALLEDGRRHLVGDRLSVADLYLFVVANWCNFIGFDLARWPHVAALVDRVRLLPAARDAMQAEGLAA